METSEIISHSTGVEVTSQNNEDTWSGGSQETGRFITCNYLQLVFIEVYSFDENILGGPFSTSVQGIANLIRFGFSPVLVI